MKLKICGLHTVQQVEAIAALDNSRQPNALGFQYGERFLQGGSPTSLKTIREMVHVACMSCIDPFFLSYCEDIEETIEQCHYVFEEYGACKDVSITPHLQIVDDLKTEQERRLRKRIREELPNIKIIQSIGVRASQELRGDIVIPATDGVIFDTRKGRQHGGTGERHDWVWSYSVMLAIRMLGLGHSVWIAGGINTSNIDEAALLGADGIDVESGAKYSDGSLNLDAIQVMAQKVRAREDPQIMPMPLNIGVEYTVQLGPYGNISYYPKDDPLTGNGQ